MSGIPLFQVPVCPVAVPSRCPDVRIVACRVPANADVMQRLLLNAYPVCGHVNPAPVGFLSVCADERFLDQIPVIDWIEVSTKRRREGIGSALWWEACRILGVELVCDPVTAEGLEFSLGLENQSKK